MRKPNKKGFTIVELVIVIAVVAILAAVLIPTFVSVVNKANVSNDTALVRNINVTIAAEEIDAAKPQTMHEALKMAERGGFDVSKLTPRSSGEIVWDSETNRFALINGNDTVFSENDKKINPSSKVWKFADKTDVAANESVYSVYLKDGVTAESLTVKTGIDVGNANVGALTYKTTDSQSIIIRTNGGNLVVDGNDATNVSHYGYAADLKVKKVASSSYHEYGTIGTLSELAAGHVEIEPTGKVIEITVNAVSSSATVTNNGQVLNFNGNNVSGNQQSDNFALTSNSEFASFREMVNSGCNFNNITITLSQDIDLSSYKNWEPIGTKTHTFTGIFDGNGHSVKNVNIINDGENIGLFGYTENAEIKNVNLVNVTISGSSAKTGALIGRADGKVTVINVTVDSSSSVTAGERVGGIVGRPYGNVYIKDCVNNAKITANKNGKGADGKDSAVEVGGIVGNIQSKDGVAIFENCTNNGNLTVVYKENTYSYAGGILGGVYGGDWYSVVMKNCINNGSLDAYYMGAITGLDSYKVQTLLIDCKNKGELIKLSSNPIGGSLSATHYFIAIQNTIDTDGNGYWGTCGSGVFNIPESFAEITYDGIKDLGSDNVWKKVTDVSSVEYSADNMTFTVNKK